MLRYIIRRSLVAVPTLIVISFILFFIMDQAPGDPAGNLPLTLPAEVRERIREAQGFNDPFILQWLKWCRSMFLYEPLHLFQSITGIEFVQIADTDRIISWSSRSAALDTVYQRLPQTLWVLGLGTLFGSILAIPIGIISAYKQYSVFDNVGTFATMLGFSLPVYFTGLLAIVIFSVRLQWFPSFYDSTHDVMFTSLSSIWIQIRQMIMPVTILTFFQASALARFTRASTLDNLNQEYVRTARSKGLTESKVINVHVMRNSLIPVVTLLALTIPGILGGAILTETVFRINGIGQLLIISIGNGDVPMVQTITFFSAFLVVIFNLFADVLYGLLDPRIRYD